MSVDPATILARVYDLPGRSTRAIVDLDAITENVRLLRANQRPDQALMAVVKADGYGHGAIMTAQAAVAGGAERLGVATVGEAAALRTDGIKAPILVLGPIDPTEIDRAVALDVELTVGSRYHLDAVLTRAENLGQLISIHIKVDTGMNRYGASVHEASSLIDAVRGSRHLRLVGICTHLATADDPDISATNRQINQFREVLSSTHPKLAADAEAHVTNSAASIRRLFPEGAFDRVGIAIYGLRPGSQVGLLPGMRPALSLVTRLARVHVVQTGEGVSYGHTYVAEGDERLGLLPLGYADGYRRALSNQAWARLKGGAGPIRGRACMDQTIVGNLTNAAREGDFVGILGPLLDGPDADQIAEWAGTINYEIVSGIGGRVPRYYVRDGAVVATLIEGRLGLL